MIKLIKYSEENKKNKLISISKTDLGPEINWGRKSSSKRKSPLYGISSYLAMFAPSLPEYFIDKYSKEGDLIADLFSGRGTAALKARELKRKYLGFDLNPYALVLSKAKSIKTKKEWIKDKIEKLEKKYNNQFSDEKFKILIKENEKMRIFYSDKVLKQLFFLREELGTKWRKIDDDYIFILSLALGLMHGPKRKDGSTMYFSLSMPNTISMSPNYVMNYAEKNNLVKPELNIFQKLVERLEKVYDPILEEEFEHKIIEHNSAQKGRTIKNNSISLIVSSPPYINIVNYTRSNWLKLWLLGYTDESIKDIKLSDKFKQIEYEKFLLDVLNNIYPKMKKNGRVCFVIGDAHEKNSIEDIWENIRNKTKFYLDEIYWDENYLIKNKTTYMLNKKRGMATKIEKVLVLIKK